MRNLLPIRKITAVALGAVLVWLARREGLDMGSDQANEAAIVIVSLAFGYAEKDPRVVDAEQALDALLARVAKQLPDES